MVQAVCCWSPTVQAQIQSQASPHGIRGIYVAMGQVYSEYFSFLPSLSFQRCLVLVHSPTTEVITLEIGSSVK